MCASSAGDNQHSLCCQDCFVFVFEFMFLFAFVFVFVFALCLYLCVYMYLCASSAGDNEHSLSCQDCITASQFKLPAPIPATFLSCSEPLVHFPSSPVSSSCISCFVTRHLLNVTIIVIRASQFKLPAPMQATFLSFSTSLHISSHPCLSFFVSRFLIDPSPIIGYACHSLND